MTPLKFQHLKYPIYGRSFEEIDTIIQPLEEKYSAFKRLKKKQEQHYFRIISYLFLLYDPGTDLNREFVRLEDRKQEASKLSGLNKLTNLSLLDSIFKTYNPEILDVIQVMLTEIFHDRDYREWQTLQKELDELTSARWDKIEGIRKKGASDEAGGQTKQTIEALNLKSKLREDCQRIRELLDELERKIFHDNEDVKEIAYKARFLSPESFSAASRQTA